MIRLTEILKEAELEDFCVKIVKDCQPFFNLFGKRFFYRGDSNKSEYFIKTIRKDRNSLAQIKSDVYNEINFILENLGFARRDKSIMCTPSVERAFRFSKNDQPFFSISKR